MIGIKFMLSRLFHNRFLDHLKSNIKFLLKFIHFHDIINIENYLFKLILQPVPQQTQQIGPVI